MMIGGYLTTIVVAMIPPLWFKLMDPKVKEWDQKYASPDELKLAEAANQRVGWSTKAAA
jgi:alkane 1-monooxygenase